MASPQLAVDPTAVFGRRVVATLIDAVLVFVPTLLLFSASFHYLDVGALNRDPTAFCDAYTQRSGGYCLDFSDVNDRVYFSDGSGNEPSIVFWGGTILLLVIVQGLTGRTLGKLVTGIRTVREDGRPPGIAKAFLRWLVWIVDGFPYVVPLLGPILALTTQGHRRLGDMAAKTFVVHASAANVPVRPGGVPGSGSTAAWAGAVPPSASGPQWDPVRNTYIQWDPTQSRWLQWDEAAQAWAPLPGQ